MSACGSTMLLVPLSKMKVRVFFNAEVDCPFTVIPDDLSCQAPEFGEMSDPYVTLPEIDFIDRYGKWA